MTVEGIKLTPLLIKSIKMYQENPDVLNHQLETFDKVIFSPYTEKMQKLTMLPVS